MTLDELTALEQAATPGPWHVTTSGDSHYRREVRRADRESVAFCGTIPEAQAHADAALIAATRNAMPLLLAVARAAHAVIVSYGTLAQALAIRAHIPCENPGVSVAMATLDLAGKQNAYDDALAALDGAP